MKINFLTLFPEMFQGITNASIWKQANDKGMAEYEVTDFRAYSDNKHNKVDDYPYGGGAGMVLRAQSLVDAVEDVTCEAPGDARVVMLCPQGAPFSQEKAEELAKEETLVLVCGHYEGFDERVRSVVTDEISVGDYVLTGGELPAMIVADSVIRLLPGVLGNDNSAQEESFTDGLLEHPHYTRPANFRGMDVPDVLLSGNHAHIEQWRRKEALRRTWERRPDLLEGRELDEEERAWLREFEE
ncbi:tRNA (guanosine(37)-N1)-methyltransferase TrmD [Salicibibacter halophilus]|uniref:tRNA (guanine-N(1)-)-methyltransferase n=1 Tax=Salicibibacter halophilus TaxID=2502791 RepID=A0A514LFA9_9BACI|nr:tRNA (guanosine(37)-N1)-methyltransferase TrmD [Salicibibacter halophilus]QDI90540.1 tRNA (guanosine(37)-N1)-methyltransferase TrmD [Salicibibacter halophilus]